MRRNGVAGETYNLATTGVGAAVTSPTVLAGGATGAYAELYLGTATSGVASTLQIAGITARLRWPGSGSLTDPFWYTGEFLLSEGNGTISREEVTVTLAGTALVSGTVMSKLSADGKYVPYDNVGTDGTEAAAGILYTSLPADTGDVRAVIIARNAEVIESKLTGINADGKTDLAAKGIIFR